MVELLASGNTSIVAWHHPRRHNHTLRSGSRGVQTLPARATGQEIYEYKEQAEKVLRRPELKPYYSAAYFCTTVYGLLVQIVTAVGGDATPLPAIGVLLGLQVWIGWSPNLGNSTDTHRYHHRFRLRCSNPIRGDQTNRYS